MYWFVSVFNYYGCMIGAELRWGVIFILFVFSPLVTAKSRRSGFLFRSVGQCVGVPVDNILRLLFLMYFSSVLPRGVMFLYIIRSSIVYISRGLVLHPRWFRSCFRHIHKCSVNDLHDAT